MLPLLLVVVAVVSTGSAQWRQSDFGTCLTNHRPPNHSDSGARDDQIRSRLDFSIALFKQIAKYQPSENVFMSPLSIYNTLLLAYFTSGGRTEMGLQKFLLLPPNKDKTDMLKAYGTHKQNLYLGKYKSQVHSANRFFISVQQTVKDCMAEIFNDEIETVDFFNGLNKAVESINKWVASKTNNKIQNLLSEGDVSRESQIVLANVAYFKGTWKSLFDPMDTKMRPFHVTKDKTVPVPMMFQINTFNHWRSDSLRAELLELPYVDPTKNQSNISLILLLPDESASQHPATDLVMRLNSAALLDIVKQSSDPRNEDKVEVKLPKFSLESFLELTPILEDMGVGDLFRPSANLTGLTGGPPISLSRAIHKAKVKVDEFGTEAAAVTVLLDDRISGETFECDRPFVYLLYDKNVESLLFAGVYNHPSQ